MMAQLMRTALYLLVILVTGVRSQGKISANVLRNPTVFYANHQSHGDFLLIWAALPVFMRHHVRPVAAGDYWLKTPLRRFFALKVFNMVLINRGDDPKQALTTMSAALQQGDSLIIFPEGTRNSSEELLPFKVGCSIYTAISQMWIYFRYGLKIFRMSCPKGDICRYRCCVVCISAHLTNPMI